MTPSFRLRGLLLACALTTTLPAFADTGAAAPPRLSDLAPPRAPDAAEPRQVTPLGDFGNARLVQLQVRAGTQMPAHAAPERVLVIVLAGSGRFEFGDEYVPLRARQVLHMAPGESHAVVAETDLDLLLVRIDEAANAAP